ncbi:MAG: bifunctional folylpolyglutamate synthase/dihydrofolate synthase [Alphaproteobacteria bacterium]|nr:bifunctional folylpolyglutamate synthase/dihydrofolate synthase [Alphaproteobacteria bacterium]
MAPSTDAILERLTRLHPKSIDLSLGRIERLLAKLGRPDLKLAPVIHVAGTNGKGSVVAYMAAALRAGGYRVQVYTSPHLVRFGERIRLVDGPIDDDRLDRVLTACERANGEDPITFFEITTAAAFVAFTAEAADVVLLEVGLGGRLDATNVVRRPLLTAITPVAIDHKSYLGNTLSKIAFEKAGILKPGVAAVLGRQTAVGEAVIARRARALGTPLVRHRRERTRLASWYARSNGDGIVVRVGDETLALPAPALAGIHQIDNAGQAVACLKTMTGVDLADSAIAEGIAGAAWPARLEPLDPAGLGLPAGAELWYDGGHNPAAARALAATFTAWRQRDPAPRPLHLVVGILSTKDARGFLRPLARIATSITAVPIPGAAAATPAAAVAALARDCGARTRVADGVAAALAALGARQARTQPPRVLITGSLYLAPTVYALGRHP